MMRDEQRMSARSNRRGLLRMRHPVRKFFFEGGQIVIENRRFAVHKIVRHADGQSFGQQQCAMRGDFPVAHGVKPEPEYVESNTRRAQRVGVFVLRKNPGQIDPKTRFEMFEV